MTALQALGLAAASTVAVVVLAGFRVARRIEPDARIWHDLGLSRPQGAAAIGALLGLAGAVGLAGALAIGWMGSGIGPVASARAVEPGWRMGVPAAVVLPVLVESTLALAGGYGGADEAAIAASLDRDEVEAWGVASLGYGVSVDGETMPAVVGQRGFDDLPVELVAGALPRGDGEIALGPRSAPARPPASARRPVTR